MGEVIARERRNWTPVLNGEIYCSPGCGGKCKKADYDLCVERADKLCETLGAGWEPRVWENLGWHYEAVLDLGMDRPRPMGRGQIQLHPTHDRRNGEVSYLCYFNSAAGQVMGERRTDPLQALATAVNKIIEKRNIYAHDLDTVTGATLGLEIE